MPISIIKNQTASIDIDAQKTFTELCPDELPVPSGQQIVAELNHNATNAAFRIGSKDAHSRSALWLTEDKNAVLSPIEGQDIDVMWPAHAIVGTYGFELLDGLPHPREYDYFVWKGIEPDMHPYGLCFHDFKETLSTGVIDFLRQQQVTTCLLGGLALDYCVKVSALQLLKHKFKVIINLAATRAMAAETGRLAIEQLTHLGARFIDNSTELQAFDDY
jgi:nicotinamidase/pyrazinamidase